jgi:hypothetical protein
MGIKAGQEWTKDKLNLQEVNLLANGGFDHNIPGVTSISNIANGAQTPFLNWFFRKSGSTPPTVNVSAETSTKLTNSRQSCKVAITTAGSSDAVCGVSQSIYNFEEFKGLKVSLRIYANAPSAQKLRAYIDDGVTKTYSDYHPGNSIWSALDVEDVTISTSATKLEVGVEYAASSADTFYVDNAMLVPGDVAVDYTGFDLIKNGMEGCVSGLNAGNKTIYNLADPINAQDAATRNFVISREIVSQMGISAAQSIPSGAWTKVNFNTSDVLREHIYFGVMFTLLIAPRAILVEQDLLKGELQEKSILLVKMALEEPDLIF